MLGDDSKYHFYVAVIPGGLRNWGHASQCVYAISDSVQGPFTEQVLALARRLNCNMHTWNKYITYTLLHHHLQTHTISNCRDLPLEFPPQGLALGPECHNPTTIRHPKTGEVRMTPTLIARMTGAVSAY